MLDRFHQHTLHCSSCRGALKGVENWSDRLFVLFVVLLAAATVPPDWPIRAGFATAAVAICGVAAYLRFVIRPKFIFVDYNHADIADWRIESVPTLWFSTFLFHVMGVGGEMVWILAWGGGSSLMVLADRSMSTRIACTELRKQLVEKTWKYFLAFRLRVALTLTFFSGHTMVHLFRCIKG